MFPMGTCRLGDLAAQPFAFAGLAALLWAISSPVISVGLRFARSSHNPLETVVIGLNIAVIVGAATLTLLRGIPEAAVLLNPYVIAAGVLTFPIATGLYYAASVSFQNRAAIAAQFANVKPVITIAAGLILFGETLRLPSVLSAICIGLGVTIILISAFRDKTPNAAVVFGLLLALAWGLGEVGVRVAALTQDRFDIAHASLLMSLPVALALLLGTRVTRKTAATAWPSMPAVAAFAAHGVLSFAGAYYFFFTSIAAHGLSHTILITTAWPTLAIALSYLVDRGSLRNLSFELIAAMALFTLGSVIHIAGTAFG